MVFTMTEAEVRLGGRDVLRGIDLTVSPGEVIAVLGPNGSGKSTLIRALLGLVPLTAGRAEIYGTPIARFRDWRRIGYVPQRLTVGGGVPSTVREVVASGRIARQSRWRPSSAADRAAVGHALEAVGMADRAGDSARELSGGQQQRVLIARALAGTLHRLVEQGRTIVLVAHELGPMEPLISRAIVLRDGRIAYEGTPPEPEGDCALPGHEHQHPHAPLAPSTLWSAR